MSTSIAIPVDDHDCLTAQTNSRIASAGTACQSPTASPVLHEQCEDIVSIKERLDAKSASVTSQIWKGAMEVTDRSTRCRGCVCVEQGA